MRLVMADQHHQLDLPLRAPLGQLVAELWAPILIISTTQPQQSGPSHRLDNPRRHRNN